MGIRIAVSGEMRSHDAAVDEPFEFRGRPIECVCMECSLRVGDIKVTASIVCPRNAFAEVVVLPFASTPFTVAKVVSRHLEIYFIEDIADLCHGLACASMDCDSKGEID